MRATPKERRKGMHSIPDGLESYLNPAQIVTLHEVARFGWELQYVRRPLFMEPVPILFNHTMNRYAVMDINGCMNRSIDVALRH
ncbi:MAG: hypothetical protein ACI89D_002588 [Bermanella sp.]|jgi:hypothetical protein